MKLAIYSRGLDFEQENPIQVLLAELMQYDACILIYKPLLVQFSFSPAIFEKLIPFLIMFIKSASEIANCRSPQGLSSGNPAE